jgi:hypothetical protein
VIVKSGESRRDEMRYLRIDEPYIRSTLITFSAKREQGFESLLNFPKIEDDLASQ